MIEVNELERKAISAVRRLRINRLKQGYPFMISSRSLPSNQSYLEYPEGRIILVTYTRNAKDFTKLRELSSQEISKIREQFDLDVVS